MGLRNTSPLATRARRSRGIPWVATAKSEIPGTETRALDACKAPLQETLASGAQQRVSAKITSPSAVSGKVYSQPLAVCLIRKLPLWL